MDNKIKVKLLKEVDRLIIFGEAIKTDPVSQDFVDTEKFYEFRMSSLAFLKNVFKDNHSMYIEFDTKCDRSKPHQLQIGIATMRAAKGLDRW